MGFFCLDCMIDFEEKSNLLAHRFYCLINDYKDCLQLDESRRGKREYGNTRSREYFLLNYN